MARRGVIMSVIDLQKLQFLKESSLFDTHCRQPSVIRDQVQIWIVRENVDVGNYISKLTSLDKWMQSLQREGFFSSAELWNAVRKHYSLIRRNIMQEMGQEADSVDFSKLPKGRGFKDCAIGLVFRLLSVAITEAALGVLTDPV
jgi:hypothetical protein